MEVDFNNLRKLLDFSFDDVMNNDLARFNEKLDDVDRTKEIIRTAESRIEEKGPAIVGKFRFNYNIKYSDGATRECIEIKKEELSNVPTGKRMSLVYLNDDIYTGFFIDLDDDNDNIILRSINNKHMIGLPYDNLFKILVERY